MWTAGSLDGNTAETSWTVFGGGFRCRFLLFQSINLFNNHENSKGNNEEVKHSVNEHAIVERDSFSFGAFFLQGQGQVGKIHIAQ